jgi:hypothetical protein
MDEITGQAGPAAWVAAFGAASTRGVSLVPHGIPLRGDPLIMIAERDLVALMFKSTLPDPDDASKTYEGFALTMFRVKDGRLTEHWDSILLSRGWMDGTRQ